MRFMVAVLFAACCAANAEVATFEGNVSEPLAKIEQVPAAAARIAARQPGSDTELERVTGQCRLESTGRTVELKKVDPWTHFGMFLEGFDGDVRIYAAGWGSDTIYFNISAQSNSSAYAALPSSAFRQGVPIDIGLTVSSRKPGDEHQEWLSCKLQLK